MKTKFLWFGLFVSFFALCARGAQPEIDFSGVLVTGAETRVALAAKGTSPAQWILVGGEFGGFTVTAYDVKSGAVILTKDGRSFRVPLKEAKTTAVVAEPTPEIKAAILNNLRQLAAASDQYYLENGKMTATLADIVGPNRYVKTLESKAGEDYRQIVFEQGKNLTVTTASGFVISYKP